MTERQPPVPDLDPHTAITLRWILRDILARRLKLTPVSENDLRMLIDMGLVELRGDEPALTPAGLAALTASGPAK
jgi:hypothetical protein